MRQKFTIRGEFLLPENFNGGFIHALELYVKHCKETWDNQPRLPSMLPDELCFPYLVDKGGESYSTFAIESYKFDNLDDSMEYSESLQEDLEENLCTD